MLYRKFFNNKIYHVFNKSIARFNIFKLNENAYRFLEILDYYNDSAWKISLSKEKQLKHEFKLDDLLFLNERPIVKFISYCVMPDHYHIVVKVLDQTKICHYLNNIGNAYTHFLNTKLNRKGPLWQSPYKMVLIKTNEQLLHVTRYVHLNPTTAQLVQKPENWEFSSYRDFITDQKYLDIVNEISIKRPHSYRTFVEDNQDYQTRIKLIKKVRID
ncbi:hypothetical protein A2866_01915 [Candidatus Roizmanbacteria bacterium RIFCSPHIGHO2_01_FULL_39_8]|uniref:Transposase IS200-like domain-containing protein n=3 Tax=Candidatus Roizmaniibacteriota TaxID=1752723 RepID=A0A1F7GR46_9BACT|nr:MAG: hypothetical protein A2866_01915 [Candidatus Roizmanbacteria bacterium RIFCSPHIGHO2_01_FULL_39_8]OGK27775.1 MAG: hypothetical protein A3C28_03940 [Candidatus Roizmanbacteria bacterium RIFCSPHIGHO2_02_FULL_39_9]OGK38086.1 MAG: hypothetical protein A3F60_03510 [Candidatus Roizmanbacteria bacterium RIFCSPHIGHO2_12_FULL_39_8]